jgi:hypothetical protein
MPNRIDARSLTWNSKRPEAVTTYKTRQSVHPASREIESWKKRWATISFPTRIGEILRTSITITEIDTFGVRLADEENHIIKRRNIFPTRKARDFEYGEAPRSNLATSFIIHPLSLIEPETVLRTVLISWVWLRLSSSPIRQAHILPVGAFSPC